MMLHQTTYQATKNNIDLPHLKELFLLYDAHHKDGFLPNRTRFHMTRLKKWLGHICILSVDHQNNDFRFELHGSRMVQYHKKDMTGQSVSYDQFGMGIEAVKAPLTMAVTMKNAIYDYANFGWETGSVRRLVLPCAEDGLTVNKLIVAIYPEKQVLSFLDGQPLWQLYTQNHWEKHEYLPSKGGYPTSI